MSTFRQVIPNSKWNPVNGRYQYFLVWLSINGGVRNWFFSHTDGEQNDQYDNYTIESLEDIRQVPEQERREIVAKTMSLDANEFEYVKSIIESNRVYAVDQEGNKTPIALTSTEVLRPNKLKNFELSIKFVFQEENILNV